jgi:DNA primase small subunit
MFARLLSVSNFLGRVCVPLDAARVDEFSPFQVPTVDDLIQYVEKWSLMHGE